MILFILLAGWKYNPNHEMSLPDIWIEKSTFASAGYIKKISFALLQK